MKNVVPMRPANLAEHLTIPPEVKAQMQSLVARNDRARRVLTANSALPETLESAKAELLQIAREAMNLWSEL